MTSKDINNSSTDQQVQKHFLTYCHHKYIIAWSNQQLPASTPSGNHLSTRLSATTSTEFIFLTTSWHNGESSTRFTCFVPTSVALCNLPKPYVLTLSIFSAVNDLAFVTCTHIEEKSLILQLTKALYRLEVIFFI